MTPSASPGFGASIQYNIFIQIVFNKIGLNKICHRKDFLTTHFHQKNRGILTSNLRNRRGFLLFIFYRTRLTNAPSDIWYRNGLLQSCFFTVCLPLCCPAFSCAVQPCCLYFLPEGFNSCIHVVYQTFCRGRRYSLTTSSIAAFSAEYAL